MIRFATSIVTPMAVTMAFGSRELTSNWPLAQAIVIDGGASRSADVAAPAPLCEYVTPTTTDTTSTGVDRNDITRRNRPRLT
jgi:hypothetical protein